MKRKSAISVRSERIDEKNNSVKRIVQQAIYPRDANLQTNSSGTIRNGSRQIVRRILENSCTIQTKTLPGASNTSSNATIASIRGRRSITISQSKSPTMNARIKQEKDVETVVLNMNPVRNRAQTIQNQTPTDIKPVEIVEELIPQDPVILHQTVRPNQKFPASAGKRQIRELQQCKYCHLNFMSRAWLKKHMEKCHANIVETVVETKEDVGDMNDMAMGKSGGDDEVIELAQHQAKTLVQMQANISTVTTDLIEKVNYAEVSERIKSKSGPNKQKLRDKLKEQLKVQQELLKVQQEIFMKANQAQNDILQLIADLDGDDISGNEDENNENNENNYENDADDEKVEEEKVLLKPKNEKPLPTDPASTQYDPLIINQSEFPENEAEEAIPIMDTTIPDDNEMFVVMEGEGGEESYELFEVIDEETETETKDQIDIQSDAIDNDNIWFEVYDVNGDNIKYRIIDQEQDQKPSVNQRKPKRSVQRRSLKSSDDVRILNNEIVTIINSADLQKMSNEEISEYIQHLTQSAEEDESGKYTCPLCEEKFTNRYSIGPHVQRVHCKQKSKKCMYCDRAFTCTGDLTRHIRIHTGDKPFKCTFPNCNCAYRASGDLHKHLRRHNETNPEDLRKHVCSTCDRAFERMYDLRRHQLTHAVQDGGDYEGFQCEYCLKKFVRKDQFNSHLLRHTGFKPFKCPICDKGFSDHGNCAKHIKAGACKHISPEDMYECDYCHKKLTTKIGIKIHVEKCWNFYIPQLKLEK